MFFVIKIFNKKRCLYAELYQTTTDPLGIIRHVHRNMYVFWWLWNIKLLNFWTEFCCSRTRLLAFSASVNGPSCTELTVRRSVRCAADSGPGTRCRAGWSWTPAGVSASSLDSDSDSDSDSARPEERKKTCRSLPAAESRGPGPQVAVIPLTAALWRAVNLLITACLKPASCRKHSSRDGQLTRHQTLR